MATFSVVDATAQRPVRAATFTGLQPGTTYRLAIEVDGVVDAGRTGQFRTTTDTSQHELLVMSCCDGEYGDVHDLHDAAYRAHVASGSSTIALHVGDGAADQRARHGLGGKRGMGHSRRFRWIDLAAVW